MSLCACKAFYCHYWVLRTALAGVTVIQIHIHPCSWQDVIIGSENSVKSYHCRDTHTQADAEKLTPCSCRETHTLSLPRYSRTLWLLRCSYPVAAEMLVPCGAQPRYLYPVAHFADNIHHHLIFTPSLPGCELRSCCCTWRHLLCLCACTCRHDFVKIA